MCLVPVAVMEKKKKDNVHFSASHRIGGDTDKYMKSFEYRLDCVSARLEI